MFDLFFSGPPDAHAFPPIVRALSFAVAAVVVVGIVFAVIASEVAAVV
jgi:hypothetical protein